MIKYFYIEDSVKNKVAYYNILAFLILLPFDRFYSTILLATFTIQSLIYISADQLRKFDKKIFILQGVFFVTLIAATYAVSAGGWNIVTRQLAIFIFPLLLGLSSLNLNKYRRQLLFLFSACCTLVVLYLFVDAVNIIHQKNLPLKTLYSASFINHHFSQPLKLHATYLSLYLLISLVFFLHIALVERRFWHRSFYIACSLLLAAGLLQLGSRAVCIAFLISILAAPLLILQGTRRLKFFIYSLIITSVLLTLVFSLDFLKQRFVTDLANDFEERSGILKNDTRLQRWQASYGIIAASPIAGHGSGAEIPLLKEVYFKNKMYSSYLNEMNVHNQFLSFLINSGIIGLVIYLLTLCWGFWQAVKQKDLLLFCFIIMITNVSFSENLLDVNKGIFFYGFFFPFFIFSQRSQKG